LRHVDELDPKRDLAAVAEIWRALAAAQTTSYFLSWSWLEHWLASLPAGARVRLVVVREGGAPIAAFFVGERALVRHRILRSRARFLHATGDPVADDLTVEHNGWLARDGRYPLADLIADLPGDWDELFLPGLPAQSLPAPPGGARLVVEKEVPSPTVDLEKVRASKEGYLALLSSSTRSQIRRSTRLYQGDGDLRLEAPATLDEALAIYDELIVLHQAAWQARGETGSFASRWFNDFHRGLVRKRFSSGEIQLMRLRAGGATVGCLYNFVWAGTVSFYQSGIAFSDDNKRKPGLTIHAEAVRHNAELGHRVYDLMGGGARYKLDLCTDQPKLIWVRVQRPRLKLSVERHARGLRDRLLAAWRARRPPEK
jgi:CelD/BcsL family acetyltransferase involved in cellulose biosynthesis